MKSPFGAGQAVGWPTMIDVPYDVNNFFANGTMTWAVDATDIDHFTYSVLGRLMYFSLGINLASSVGGTPSTELRAKVPGGFLVNKTMIFPIYIVDNSTRSVGNCICSIGDSFVKFRKNDLSNWTASTNATAVFANFFIEIR